MKSFPRILGLEGITELTSTALIVLLGILKWFRMYWWPSPPSV